MCHFTVQLHSVCSIHLSFFSISFRSISSSSSPLHCPSFFSFFFFFFFFFSSSFSISFSLFLSLSISPSLHLSLTLALYFFFFFLIHSLLHLLPLCTNLHDCIT
ncbi:MAG: hypothetical protein J3Q66DRAFT_1260 [Benniella sp.]|nr:MAG: hypothetical protein J3Q66DRAFT_1260 [Benniella sp.]